MTFINGFISDSIEVNCIGSTIFSNKFPENVSFVATNRNQQLLNIISWLIKNRKHLAIANSSRLNKPSTKFNTKASTKHKRSSACFCANSCDDNCRLSQVSSPKSRLMVKTMTMTKTPKSQ